jgi:photosystem II stability/assembly factor-like uncharacterized protein
MVCLEIRPLVTPIMHTPRAVSNRPRHTIVTIAAYTDATNRFETEEVPVSTHPAFRLAAATMTDITIVDIAADGVVTTTHTLTEPSTSSVAIDPLNPDRIVAGTFDRSAWLTTDGGDSWAYVGHGVHSTHVSAVAMSPARRTEAGSAIYVGTEPANLYRSGDDGATWEFFPALPELPSSRTWSVPPRPWTHHTRWITPHPEDPDVIFVGVELGGVMRTTDGGATWEDRKPGSQFDCHSLAIPAADTDRLYEAAGGGVAISLDRGATWQAADEGMDRHYAWSVAVDPVDPDCWYVSASTGARAAHRQNGDAQGVLYRRTGGGPWKPLGVPAGEEPDALLHHPNDVMPYALATLPGWPDGLIVGLRDGTVLLSSDRGETYSRLDTDIPGILTFTTCLRSPGEDFD